MMNFLNNKTIYNNEFPIVFKKIEYFTLDENRFR